MPRERKGDGRKKGDGSRECYFFQNNGFSSYMKKWEDCKFEHGGENGGKETREGKWRGETRSAPDGEEEGEEEPERQMRTRALRGCKANQGQARTEGRVRVQ